MSKLKFGMKNFVFVSVIAMFLFSRCNNNSSGETCINCLGSKPTSAPLFIKLTINNENPYVPIIIFKGKFKYDYNSSDIVHVDTVSDSNFAFNVEPDNYYSVRAEYKDGSKVVYAIDGDNLTTTKCSDDCWDTSGGNIDVRLKK